jgi:hypothetical protein
MPRTPQRAGWWRFLAPSILLLTLVVAILPVLEAGSEGSPKAFEAMNLGRQMMGQKKIGESGKFVTLTQNEYQAVWGGYSDGPEIAEEKREAERRGREWLRDHPEEVEKLKQMGQEMQKWAKENGLDKQPKEESLAAPLLGAYFGFVILALILGYALPPGRIRTGIFAGTVLVAAALLAIQTVLGLPVYHKTAKTIKDVGNLVDGANNMARAVGVKVESPRPYIRYTPWYYSAWPFLLLPLGLVVVEEAVALLAGIGKKKSRRSYPDEDDDEDDRPRSRRRREDEDEEDEPPRKKRRYQDEDEDERPRKRRL